MNNQKLTYTNTLQLARDIAFFQEELRNELDNRFPDTGEVKTLRKEIILLKMLLPIDICSEEAQNMP